jgi:hypothetical protein
VFSPQRVAEIALNTEELESASAFSPFLALLVEVPRTPA